jgi:hypothetical protein
MDTVENSVRHPFPSYEELERERHYWDAHFDEYLQIYPEKFVAVYDGEIVATDSDLEGLAAKLRARALLGTGKHVWIQFISLKIRQLLL